MPVYKLPITKKKQLKKKKLLFIFLILLLTQSQVNSETMPPITRFDAGVINNLNQSEIKELDVQKYDYQDRVAPMVEDSAMSAHESYTGDSGVIVNPSFELKKIVFVGNTIFKEKELDKYFSKLVNQTVYISDVFDAVDKITKLYNTSGYFTSYAYVPPQRIEDNSVVVNIVEGKIGQIDIEGNTRSKDVYLRNAVLASNGLAPGDVFNVNNIKKSLDTINTKNYITGQVAIEDGKKPNSTDLKLRIAERFPLSFNAIWDNGGNRLVGRQRNIMVLSQDNLFGLGHSIYGGSVLARGTVGALAGYKMPVGKHGTELQFDYSFAKVNLLEEQAANNINGKANVFSARVVQPLYKTNNVELKTDLGVDFVNSSSTMYANNTPVSPYKLTVVRNGLNLTTYDKSGINAARVESSFGVPILGATESTSGYFNNGSSTDPQSAFYKLRADLTRLQRLPKDCYGIFRVSTQYSPNNLYASEQMMFGGIGSIRGFEPGNCLGDVGANGTFEIRTPFPLLKAFLPKAYESFDKKVKLGFFYDWGVFSQQNTGTVMAGSTNLLQSVGTGIHFNVTRSMIASFELGIPVGASIYKEHGAMLHFSLKADLWDLFAKKPQIKNL